MKKLMSLVAVGALAGLMGGCGVLDTDTDSITIQITAFATAPAGSATAVDGTIDASAEIEITDLSITILDDASVDKTSWFTIGKANFTAMKKVDITDDLALTITPIAATVCNGNYTLKIEGTSGSATSSDVQAFAVTGGQNCSVTTTPVTSATVTLGAHGSAIGSAVDLDNGTVMLAAAAKAAGAAADIMYTYSATLPGPVLMNPYYATNTSGIAGFTGWTGASQTKFHKVTANFDATDTKEAIEALYVAASATEDRVGCAVGDVFVVLTNEGNYVLVRIDTVSADATGTATLKYAK